MERVETTEIPYDQKISFVWLYQFEELNYPLRTCNSKLHLFENRAETWNQKILLYRSNGDELLDWRFGIFQMSLVYSAIFSESLVRRLFDSGILFLRPKKNWSKKLGNILVFFFWVGCCWPLYNYFWYTMQIEIYFPLAKFNVL